MKNPLIPEVQVIEKLIQYNLAVTIVTGPQQVPLQEFCNGFTMKNTGNSWVSFMGDILQAGESKAFGGNRGEIYVGRIDIKFVAANPVVAPRIDSCTITEKYYMNVPRNTERPGL